MYKGNRDLRREKIYIERLWDGNLAVFSKLCQLKEVMIILDRDPLDAMKWLFNNKVTGIKILDFFNEAQGEETPGVIKGAKYIINRIDGDKFNKDPLRKKKEIK